MREEHIVGTVFDPLISGFDTAEQKASHATWLRSEIAKSIADPRPSIPHDEAMARIRHTLKEIKQYFS